MRQRWLQEDLTINGILIREAADGYRTASVSPRNRHLGDRLATVKYCWDPKLPDGARTRDGTRSTLWLRHTSFRAEKLPWIVSQPFLTRCSVPVLHSLKQDASMFRWSKGHDGHAAKNAGVAGSCIFMWVGNEGSPVQHEQRQ